MGRELCNCTFTLAYGTKVLLRNVSMRLKRNHHYGLLGPNDCGKTTLLRSIANEQVDGEGQVLERGGAPPGELHLETSTGSAQNTGHGGPEGQQKAEQPT